MLVMSGVARVQVVDTQSPEELVQRGLKSSLIGIGFNLILASFKCVAGLAGHSFALIADGIESLSDVVSSCVVYFGLRLAIKPPDKEHPYGHGKAEPIAAVIVSLALILAAIVIAIESIQRIKTPHPLPHAYTLWVLLAVVGVKILSVSEIDSRSVENLLGGGRNFV
jgi:cation diffusion facilitator family transporter